MNFKFKLLKIIYLLFNAFISIIINFIFFYVSEKTSIVFH